MWLYSTEILVQTLHDIERKLPETKLNKQELILLKAITAHSNDVLSEVKKFLDHNESLDPASPSIPGNRMKRFWKRLTTSSEEILTLQHRLDRTTTQVIQIYGTLNNALARKIDQGLHSVHTDVRGIERHLAKIELSLEDQLILTWLSGSASQPMIMRSPDQAGTGMWFLKHDVYLEWHRGYTQTLVCPGMAGAGKSVMMSFVLDHLWNSYQLQPEIRIAQISCQYQLKDQ